STLLLLKTVGWSSALMESALLIALIIPLAWMLKGPSTQTPKAIAQPQLTFKQVLHIARKHKPFLWLALGFLVFGFQVVFLGVHLPGYLIDHGFDAATGTV
ncbi:MFS transporter, partial [Acinetobacter baumannii]